MPEGHQPTFRPTGVNVLVRAVTRESRQTVSGIVIPDSVDEEDDQVVDIVAVGDSVHELAPGDRVYVKRIFTEPIKLDGQPHFIIEEEDVLARVIPEGDAK